MVKKICWRYDYKIINIGDIDFELVEIECLHVVDFANYNLFGSIYEDAGKLRRESFRDFIIL